MGASHADVLATIAAGFLGLVFLRALLHKVGDYTGFVDTLRNYRMLPEAALPLVAPVVVATEAVAAAGLVMPSTRAAAAGLAAVQLLVYALAIAVNLARGRTSIDCGCGGGGQGISPLHVVRNGLLAMFALPAMLIHSPPPSGFGVSLAAAGCVFVLWVTFVAFDQLLGNRTHAVATTYSSL